MVEGEVESAQAVTHTRIAVTQDDGTVVIKQVLESLDNTPQQVTAEPKQPEVYSDVQLGVDEPMDDPIIDQNSMSPPIGQSK